jgi:hypothetical protein
MNTGFSLMNLFVGLKWFNLNLRKSAKSAAVI